MSCNAREQHLTEFSAVTSVTYENAVVKCDTEKPETEFIAFIDVVYENLIVMYDIGKSLAQFYWTYQCYLCDTEKLLREFC